MIFAVSRNQVQNGLAEINQTLLEQVYRGIQHDKYYHQQIKQIKK